MNILYKVFKIVTVQRCFRIGAALEYCWHYIDGAAPTIIIGAALTIGAALIIGAALTIGVALTIIGVALTIIGVALTILRTIYGIEYYM